MVLRNDSMVFMMLGIVSCWTSFRFLFGKLNSRGVGWWGSNPRHWTSQRVPTLLGYHSESNNIHPPPPPLLNPLFRLFRIKILFLECTHVGAGDCPCDLGWNHWWFGWLWDKHGSNNYWELVDMTQGIDWDSVFILDLSGCCGEIEVLYGFIPCKTNSNNYWTGRVRLPSSLLFSCFLPF